MHVKLPILAFALSLCVAQIAAAQQDDTGQALQRAADELRQAAESLDRVREAQAANPPGGGGGDIDGMREELEDLRTDMEEQDSSIQDELARRLTVSGYSTSFLQMRQGEDSFFRAFRVNLILDARIVDRLSFYAEIEFEDPKAIGEGHGVVEGERGYMQLALTPALMLRAGIVLVPFGSFNLEHESWRYAFAARPVMSSRIIPSTYADVGIGALGTLWSTDNAQLDYEATITNGLTSDIARTGGKALRSSRPSFGGDNNGAKSFTGRMTLTVGDLALGLSGYWGPYEDSDSPGGSAAITMGGADARIETSYLLLRAEGVITHIGAGQTLQDADSDPMTPDTYAPFASATMAGAVVEAEVRFFPTAWEGSFLSFSDATRFFVAARGGFAHQDFGSSLTEYRLTGSVGFRPVHDSALRFEYARGFGDRIELGDAWQALLSFSMGY